MKMISLFIVFISLFYVSAAFALTLNSPDDGDYLQGLGALSADSSLAGSTMSFYLDGDGTFDDEPVCSYAATGTETKTCNAGGFMKASVTANRMMYLKFDDNGSGTQINDSSGNGNNVANVYGATHSESYGWNSGAYYFDGNDDYLQVDYTADLNITSVWSIAFWARHGSILSSSTTILSRDQVGIDPLGAPNVYYRTAAVQFEVNNVDAVNCYFNGDTVDTDWHFVAITRDGTTTTIYWDGEYCASQNIAAPYSSSYYWMIGRRGGTSGSFFEGYIDEVQIWNGTALTAEQVAGMYQFGEGRYYWQVRDVGGSTQTDSRIFYLDLNDPVITKNFLKRIYDTQAVALDLGFSDTYDMTISVTDPSGTFCSVSGVNSYSCDTSAARNFGSYLLTATATDLSGRTAIRTFPYDVMHAVDININNNAPVSINVKHNAAMNINAMN
jgi:hypothetical protein